MEVLDLTDPSAGELVIVAETAELPIDTPLKLQRVDVDRWIIVAASAAGAFAVTWLLFTRITQMSGSFGFFVVWFVAFLTLSYAVGVQRWGRVGARDHLARMAISGVALSALFPLLSILATVVTRGYRAVSWSFVSQDMSRAGTLDPFDAGGVLHSIIGTLEIVAIALVLAVPLGVVSAIFLNEIGGRLARPVRMLTDAMSAIPSIVAGLFIFGLLITTKWLPQNGFAGGLALTLLMLPTITRTTEVVLRLVPGGLREASLALGGTEWRTVRLVVLPTARTGLVTSVLLGVARVIGETAPLVVTMLGAQIFAGNPFGIEKQDALPLFVFSQHKLSTGDGSLAFQRAWAGAFVLMFLVLIVFSAARMLGGRAGKRRARVTRTSKSPERTLS